MWMQRYMPRRPRWGRMWRQWPPISPKIWPSGRKMSISRPRPTKAWGILAAKRALPLLWWSCWRRSSQAYDGWAMLQGIAAHWPVAGAQFFRLQPVEHPQYFSGIASYIHAVYRHMLDDVVGVDDEGGPQCHAFLFFAYAQLVDQGACRVAKLVMAELVQLGMFAAPSQLDVFVID